MNFKKNNLCIPILIIITTIMTSVFFNVTLKSVGANMETNIKRFSAVDEFLYRGSQPTYADLKNLKEKGIKRIINFRNEKKNIAKEKKEVESLDLEYISIPWTIYSAYNQKVFDTFFESITDKKPTFFHCKRGSERTGVIAAAYKIKFFHLSYKEAITDAKNFDLKLIWLGYVKSKIKKFYTLNT